MKALTLAVLGIVVGALFMATPAGAPPPGWSPPPLPKLYGEYQVSAGVFKADLTANQVEHKVKTSKVLLEQRTSGGWKVRDRADVSMKAHYAAVKLSWKLPRKPRKVFVRVRSFGPTGQVANLGSTLVHVSGKPLKAKAISEGFGQTCAVLANDRLKCWGLNKQGELGTGDKKWTTRPVAVSKLGRVRQVSAAGGYTCAIRWNRKLACWGSNFYGVLGSGDREDSLVPKDVTGLGRVRQVSTGPTNVCAMDMAGKVFCWGSDGGFSHKERFMVRPVQIKGLKNVSKVKAGHGYSCAILKSKKATCWDHKELKPKPRKRFGRVNQLLLAFEGGCALRVSKRVVCWGYNGWGELGNGTKRNSGKTPVRVKRLGKIKSIGGQGESRCAIDFAGKAWCWGMGESGGLGNGETRDRLVPVRVRGISNAVRITSPEAQGNCVLKRNRTIACWGDNSAGSVGNGTTIDQLTPVLTLRR